MITNSSTEKSARKWAQVNAPECVEYTVLQLIVFLTVCSDRDGMIWLSRGWDKIWERVEENLEDEKSSDYKAYPISAKPKRIPANIH